MIWLIGARGMLGQEVAFQLGKRKLKFVSSGSDVDVTKLDILQKFAVSAAATNDEKIDFIVNCSAYTAVDKSEDEKEAAFAVNETGAMNIAKVAKELGAELIHVSTDYVFDGTLDYPITETEQKHPIGVYGESKSCGEDAIMREMNKYYILRTAWLYGFHGKNFVYTMTKAFSARDSVKVVADQKGTPTNCSVLAYVIVEILRHQLRNKFVPYGIYNVTDLGQTTWFEFTKEIYRLLKRYKKLPEENACVINSCTTEEYPTKAKRPAYSVLDKTKIQKALHIKLPKWEKSLSGFIKSKDFNPL